jgi:PD-(D/E)XK nuclease superfamily
LSLPFAHTGLGSAFLGLLSSAFPEEDSEPGVGPLFAFLRAPGVLSSPLLADELELFALRSGLSDLAGVRALRPDASAAFGRIDRLAAAPRRAPAALVELERLSSDAGRLFDPGEYAALTAASSLLSASGRPAAGGARELIASLRALLLPVEPEPGDAGEPDAPDDLSVGAGPGAPGGAPPAPLRSETSIAPLSDPVVLEELRSRRFWSASALQAWASCPARWFMENFLSASDLSPEAEPLARGGLAHVALRETFEGLRSEFGSARLSPANLGRARSLLSDALSRHADDRPLSVYPERLPPAHRRLSADLLRYLDHAASWGADDSAEDSSGGAIALEPTFFELAFGFDDEPDSLPALDLGDGILIRGRIDRIDVAPDGSAVVYDYKNSVALAPDKWLAERSFQLALYMRAAASLPGVTVVGGLYQPLSGRDLRARGLLSLDSGLDLPLVRGDAREAADLDGLVDEVVASARTAALEARAGALAPRPSTCGYGGSGCMYPSFCRSGR